MALFPQRFIEDLRQQADIVVVIQDYVSLKKVGAAYKGLCPFHGEKTPSFQVNRDKGFFHCFGCGVGGDVFKFLELHEKIGFVDAVKVLAQRVGMPLPETEESEGQRASATERETLTKIHAAAATWFRQQLDSPAGARVRAQIAARGVSPATADALGLGYAPAGREGVKQALVKQGFSTTYLVRAGLLVERDDGSVIDRFRNRLMIPICRDTGAVIAFGGRAVDADQQPKYLNSPETPIYSKGRTLYGLNLSKGAIRQGGFVVLVEGYFDFAQLYQAGFRAVVASCGTALTPQQAQQLHRFAQKVVLSFDPDVAGQGAAEKSSELLVTAGFEVNVVVLPQGADPDAFIRQHGGSAYGERLRRSRPYLEYLLDRAAARLNLNLPDDRVRFIEEMKPVIERIPNRIRQELFVKEVAGRAGVSEEAIWKGTRKALTRLDAQLSSSQLPGLGQVTKAEKGLIWFLVNDPPPALAALAGLGPGDLEALAAGPVLDLARKLNEDRGFSPATLLERLTMAEANLVTAVASEREPPVHDAEECGLIIRRFAFEREYAGVQHQIDRLQREGGQAAEGIQALLERKRELLKRIAELKFSPA